MREPIGQQQLNAAMLRWNRCWVSAFRDKIASVMASSHNLEVQQELQRLLMDLDSVRLVDENAHVGLAATITSVPISVANDERQQSLANILSTITALADRALSNEAYSLSDRQELLRRVRLKYQVDCEQAHRNAEWSHMPEQLIVSCISIIELAILPTIDVGKPTLASKSTAADGLPDLAGFPRFWEILAYLLPRDFRQRVYEPARVELFEDYLCSRSCCHGWWSRLALNGVFFVRTLGLAGECGQVLFSSRAAQFWLWVVRLVVTWVIRLIQRPPQ